MEHGDALDLIRAAVERPGGVWADLGAGSGTFTHALSELLGAGAVIHALDLEPQLASGVSAPGRAAIVSSQGDFRRPLPYRGLDGILMANALHFAPHAEEVLARVVAALRPGGTLVLVEYDLLRGNPWVPFPLPAARFRDLAEGLGLEGVREIGRRPSRYRPRDLYAATARTRS